MLNNLPLGNERRRPYHAGTRLLSLVLRLLCCVGLRWTPSAGRLRPLPLRQARLAAIGKGAESWIALTKGIVGDGCALYRAVVAADLGGHRRQASGTTTRSWPALHRTYSQRHGRAEWFPDCRGRYASFRSDGAGSWA